jgi:putative flippase GtrA
MAGIFQKLKDISQSRTARREIPRFVAVGCSAVLTDALVYWLLIPFFPYALAKAASFISGAVISYFLNKFWTFAHTNSSPRDIPAFIGLNLMTLAANVFVNHLSLSLVPEAVFLAFILATGTSTVLNFCGQKWWVFKHSEPSRE